LRKVFNQSIPQKVDESFVSLRLGGANPMEPQPAKNNIIYPMIRLGLLEQDGSPTELVYDWRSDEKYASACQTMLENTYPESLRSAIPPEAATFESARSWFMNFAKQNQAAAAKSARMYVLLCNADPSKSEIATAPSKSRTQIAKPQRTQTPKVKPAVTEENLVEHVQKHNQPTGRQRSDLPTMHIDVQIHIDPSADADQIDAIFASMAKHLYGSGVGNGS
jgi:hypothetical protein